MNHAGTQLPVVTSPNRQTVDLEALHSALAEQCQGEVRFDRISRGLYSTDASVYQIVPLGVVLPRSEEDIVHTVRTCARFGVPLTPRGGGTSQAGQCIGPGVILDCSKYYNSVLEIDPAERWARVQPGCVLSDLNERLKPFGLHFAPDISTANRATIGGMIANNSSGTRSVIYGKTIDHVLELKVLLSDGEVIHTGPLDADEWQGKCSQEDLEGRCYRTVQELIGKHADEIDRRYPKILRRVGGYNLRELHEEMQDVSRNLAHLFVGSEGTLGVVLQAKLNLVPLPQAKGLLVVQFHELLEALSATPAILKHGPSAVEVMDRYILNATKLNAEASRLRSFLHGDPGAILIIEFYGDNAADIKTRLDHLQADLENSGRGYRFLQAHEPAAQQRIWKLRTLALGLSMAEKGDAKSISFVEDTAVNPEHLRDYIAEFLEIVAAHGTRAGVYAHASVGCLHVRPVIDLKSERGLCQFQNIAEDVADLVVKYQGALSGEHGDGLVRSPFQEKMYGPVLYQAFRELKRAFDPDGLFNPGKIVDSPPLAANLRYGSGYATPTVATTFDFAADGGIARAAEMCAGVGECRKRQGGAMCPSFRATRDERHSTRARANVLRLAITGQCGLQGLTDPGLLEVFDLCLECKACKSECPTNVDVARLKAEFLHQHYARHGFPRRNRILGMIDALSRWGSRLAPMSNWLVRGGPQRWLNEKLLGIDRRRSLPCFARKTFVRQFASRFCPQAEEAHQEKRVLLFPDTFTNYYQPEIGLAAARLLHQAGISVTLGPPDLKCCGRPLISMGLLTGAVERATHNVERLFPWAEKGGVIAACEPSCLLTIKDDYPALLRGEMQRRALAVASQCRTFEEAIADGSRKLLFRGGPSTVLVHAHCHQRSLVGMRPIMNVLQHIPGAEVVDLDAGCCGMAGAFGYEQEHYEISRQVGEQSLFPALREAAGAEVAIVSPGFSCRLQIEHFTGMRPLHPAVLLAELGMTNDE